MRRGSRIHEFIEADIRWSGDLSLDELPPDESGCVLSARRARELLELDAHPLNVELLVASEVHHYATQIDLVTHFRGDLAVVNWKSGGRWPHYQLQLMGEAVAYAESYGSDEGLPKRLAIYLRDDGGFDPKADMAVYDDPADHARWFACLSLFEWKVREGLIRLEAPEVWTPEPMPAKTDMFASLPAIPQGGFLP